MHLPPSGEEEEKKRKSNSFGKTRLWVLRLSRLLNSNHTRTHKTLKQSKKDAILYACICTSTVLLNRNHEVSTVLEIE